MSVVVLSMVMLSGANKRIMLIVVIVSAAAPLSFKVCVFETSVHFFQVIGPLSASFKVSSYPAFSSNIRLGADI